MTCMPDLYTDYLLSSTGPTTATGLSRLLEGALSHDYITRWLSSTPCGPAEVWRQAKPPIRQAEAQRPAEEFAVLIVNDSVLGKAHTDANELIFTHWNHSQQRYVKGLHFVSLRYQAGELVRKTVPVYLPKTQKTSSRSPFTKTWFANDFRSSGGRSSFRPSVGVRRCNRRCDDWFQAWLLPGR